MSQNLSSAAVVISALRVNLPVQIMAEEGLQLLLLWGL